MTFEEVAALLWGNRTEHGDWSAPAARTVSPHRQARSHALGAGHVWRHRSPPIGRRPIAVFRCRATGDVAAAWWTSSVRARPPKAALHSIIDPPGSPARRIEPAVSAAAVDAALVLMADHELATSTLAVRIAASVRADLYDALLAGMATLAGPLHGGASQQAYELLVIAERDGASRALNDTLRERRLLPGFGHTVYRNGDPRFAALLVVGGTVAQRRPARTSWREVMELAAAHDIPQANCDLALAALSWGTGMPPDTGRTLFAVARIAGWTAHYMEELSRASGTISGPSRLQQPVNRAEVTRNGIVRPRGGDAMEREGLDWEGWFTDPFGRHQARWLSLGIPTKLVREQRD